MHTDQTGMTTTCPVCGLFYSRADAEDFKHGHPRIHDKFVRLHASRGVQNGADREASKSRGWELVLHGKTVAERTEGALAIMKAHYDRDLLGRQDEPDFRDWAAAYNVEKEFGWAEGVVQEIRRLFPRHRPEA